VEKHQKFLEEHYVLGPTTIRRSMENRQKRFLKAYISAGYNISEACKKSGINRHTVLTWKKKDQEFASKMWEIEESIADFVESQMLKQIRNNNPAMIMWFLETKGKNRGYTRKYEIDNNVKIELSTEQIDAMVRAHELAVKDNGGSLMMPLQLSTGKEKNDTDSDDRNESIDTEYRESDEDDEASNREDETFNGGITGSEVPGTQ